MRKNFSWLENIILNRKETVSLGIGLIVGIPSLVSDPSLGLVIAKMLIYAALAYSLIESASILKEKELDIPKILSILAIWLIVAFAGFLAQGNFTSGGLNVAAENPITGECKLIHTSSGIPWYYKECSVEEIETIDDSAKNRCEAKLNLMKSQIEVGQEFGVPETCILSDGRVFVNGVPETTPEKKIVKTQDDLELLE